MSATTRDDVVDLLGEVDDLIVERIIANLTRYHDARQARRRGRAKADYQAKKSGTAFNLRQWLRQRRQRDLEAKIAQVMPDPSHTGDMTAT